MSTYTRYVAGVFVVALLLNAIGSISALAGTGPPTRDINVRVVGICAAPDAVEPHDGGDGEVCLCFGGFFNGFNATSTQPNGRCARSQVGPFCFVDTVVGPLFWKETVSNQSGSTTVEAGQIVQASVPCPDGKMVISCEGAVTVGSTDEVAANVSSNIFPTADGFACRHVARADRECPDCPVCPDCQVFPGDGQLGLPVGFDLPDHGPALSYTDNSDGTVTDNNTLFDWEMKTGSVGTPVDCTDATVCPDPHNVNNRYTWTDTGDGDFTDPDGTLFTVFEPQLNDACDGDPTITCNSDLDCGADAPCGFAGHRDWCVPNVKRLQSIVDYAVFSPSIDATFGPTQSSFYWTSTTSASGTVSAWVVGFGGGSVGDFGKFNDLFARAVRPCS